MPSRHPGAAASPRYARGACGGVGLLWAQLSTQRCSNGEQREGGKGGEDIQYRAAQACPGSRGSWAARFSACLPPLVPGWLARLAAGWRLL